MPKSYADKVAYWGYKVILCIINRRAKQIFHRDHAKLIRVDNIDDDHPLCFFNSMKVTWFLEISQSAMRLLNRIITLDVSYQNIMKRAYLLESSTDLPVENIFHMFSSIANTSVKNDLLKLLLYNLPVYHLSLSSKDQ